jgi:hypothetical protein
MLDADLVSLVLLPLGLGLMGFVEPCSVGSSLLFVRYVEGGDAATKVAQVAVFALTRALVAGLLGAGAALVGAVFLGFQKAGWVVLGALYVALGAAYLAGRAGALMRGLGPGLGRLAGGTRGGRRPGGALRPEHPGLRRAAARGRPGRGGRGRAGGGGAGLRLAGGVRAGALAAACARGAVAGGTPGA